VTVVSGNASSASRSRLAPFVARTTNTDSYGTPDANARGVTRITIPLHGGLFERDASAYLIPTPPAPDTTRTPVSGQDREALVQRLHDEHPVERIVVVQREIAQEITMSQADCQRDELISRDDALYEPIHP